VTIVALACALVWRASFISWLGTRELASSIGAHEPLGTFQEVRRGLLHGAVVGALTLFLALQANRRASLAGALALVLVTADLAAANARYVLTVPQKLLEAPSRVLEIIAEAEAKDPSPGPYRVHRMPLWSPIRWGEEVPEDRVRDFVIWERETLQPKYGITEGIHYTLAIGVAELYDYEWFFGGFYRKADSFVAKALGATPGQNVVVYPRRAFDLWTTRYFVLPMFPNGWKDENRGFASMLENSTRLFPSPTEFEGPGGEEKELAWVKGKDYQVRRSSTEYPRAWVVHRARFVKPITGLERADRDAPMEEILFSNEYLWRDGTRIVYDPPQLAWIESEQRTELAPFLSGGTANTGETAAITRYEPERVEIDAVLDRPGLVVLADVFYPGWSLTIDGAPAPIYRADRAMRGAAVPAGKHHLVYTYSPTSFRAGLIISAAGFAAILALTTLFFYRPVASTLADPDQEPPELSP
jgi:hypothetical protein